MDLDGDGIKDLLTGSPSGLCHFFRGLGGGEFAASHVLAHASDKKISLGSFSNVTTVDWNGDGILDLVAYSANSLQGSALKLLIGKGDLLYELPVPLPVDGSFLPSGTQKDSGIHDGRVCFGDWNGDGAPDLLLGRGEGSVTVHLGRRDETKTLVLGPGERLIEPHSGILPSSEVIDYATMTVKNPRCGIRPTITMTDWNGDGLLDLLIGDVFTVQSEDKLPPEVRQQEEAMTERLREQDKALSEIGRNFQEQALAELGKPPGTKLSELQAEERKRYAEVYRKMTAGSQEYQDLSAKNEALRAELSKFARGQESAGYVWVYLQKRPAAFFRNPLERVLGIPGLGQRQ